VCSEKSATNVSDFNTSEKRDSKFNSLKAELERMQRNLKIEKDLKKTEQ
jgi:hypothetical protein